MVSVVPSTLGFGIGVYALIFSLNSGFIKDANQKLMEINEESSKLKATVLLLNADLAFPLVVLAASLIVGILQQAIGSSIPWIVFTWIIIWYAILCLLELISSIFGLAEHSLLDKLQ